MCLCRPGIIITCCLAWRYPVLKCANKRLPKKDILLDLQGKVTTVPGYDINDSEYRMATDQYMIGNKWQGKLRFLLPSAVQLGLKAPALAFSNPRPGQSHETWLGSSFAWPRPQLLYVKCTIFFPTDWLVYRRATWSNT